MKKYEIWILENIRDSKILWIVLKGSSGTKSCKVKEDVYDVSCGSSVQRECADIWHAAETKKFQYFQQQRDPRVRPEYQMKYKQSLGTQDVFLGVSTSSPIFFILLFFNLYTHIHWEKNILLKI